MPISILPHLDLINLRILKAIAQEPDISTREIENIIFLSKSQALRRLKQLEEQGLIIKRGGMPGRPYRYTLGSSVAIEDIEQLHLPRLMQNRDAIAREALGVLLEGMQAFSAQLAELVRRIDAILK